MREGDLTRDGRADKIMIVSDILGANYHIYQANEISVGWKVKEGGGVCG